MLIPVSGGSPQVFADMKKIADTFQGVPFDWFSYNAGASGEWYIWAKGHKYWEQGAERYLIYSFGDAQPPAGSIYRSIPFPNMPQTTGSNPGPLIPIVNVMYGPFSFDDVAMWGR